MGNLSTENFKEKEKNFPLMVLIIQGTLRIFRKMEKVKKIRNFINIMGNLKMIKNMEKGKFI